MAEKPVIIVSGVPQGITMELLTIHFQKPSNGGGEVIRVIYPLTPNERKDEAMVIFQDLEVAKRAASRKQEIDIPGWAVKAEVTVKLQPQVFEYVRATVTKKLTADLKEVHNNELSDFLEYLKRESHASKIMEEDSGIVIEGSFYQVQNAHRVLENEIAKFLAVDQKKVVGAERERRSKATGNFDRDGNEVDCGDQMTCNHDTATSEQPTRNKAISKCSITVKELKDNRDREKDCSEFPKDKQHKQNVSDHVSEPRRRDSRPNTLQSFDNQKRIDTNRQSDDSSIRTDENPPDDISEQEKVISDKESSQDVCISLPSFVRPFVMRQFKETVLEKEIQSLQKSFSSKISFTFKKNVCFISRNKYSDSLREKLDDLFSKVKQRQIFCGSSGLRLKDLTRIAEKFQNMHKETCWCSYSKENQEMYIVTTGDFPDTKKLQEKLNAPEVQDSYRRRKNQERFASKQYEDTLENFEKMSTAGNTTRRDKRQEIARNTFRSETRSERDDDNISRSDLQHSKNVAVRDSDEITRSKLMSTEIGTEASNENTRAVSQNSVLMLDEKPELQDKVVEVVQSQDAASGNEDKLHTKESQTDSPRTHGQAHGQHEQQASGYNMTATHESAKTSVVNEGGSSSKCKDAIVGKILKTIMMSTDKFLFWKNFYKEDYSHFISVAGDTTTIQPGDTFDKVAVEIVAEHEFLEELCLRLKTVKSTIKKIAFFSHVNLLQYQVSETEVESMTGAINREFPGVFLYVDSRVLIRIIGRSTDSKSVREVKRIFQEQLTSIHTATSLGTRGGKEQSSNKTSGTQNASDPKFTVGERLGVVLYQNQDNKYSQRGPSERNCGSTVRASDVEASGKYASSKSETETTEDVQQPEVVSTTAYTALDIWLLWRHFYPGEYSKLNSREDVRVDIHLTDVLNEIAFKIWSFDKNSMETLFQLIKHRTTTLQQELKTTHVNVVHDKVTRSDVEEIIEQVSRSCNEFACLYNQYPLVRIVGQSEKIHEARKEIERLLATSSMHFENDLNIPFEHRSSKSTHNSLDFSEQFGNRQDSKDHVSEMQKTSGIESGFDHPEVKTFDRKAFSYMVKYSKEYQDLRSTHTINVSKLQEYEGTVEVRLTADAVVIKEMESIYGRILQNLRTFFLDLSSSSVEYRQKEVDEILKKNNSEDVEVYLCSQKKIGILGLEDDAVKVQVVLRKHFKIEQKSSRHGRRPPEKSEIVQKPESPAKAETLCKQTPEGLRVEIYSADITKIKVGAICNAANRRLNHGGGVAGAISRAAGRCFDRESEDYIYQNGPMRDGDVMYQNAFGALVLNTFFVINAVGPRWDDYRDKEQCLAILQKTFMNVLRWADSKMEVKDVAIPLISSGIFGVPVSMCAEQLKQAVFAFSRCHWSRILSTVHLVNIDTATTRKIVDEFQKDTLPTSLASEVEDRYTFTTPEGLVVRMLTDDITKVKVGAIVNPTDCKLSNAGGISQAIASAGGDKFGKMTRQIVESRQRSRRLIVDAEAIEQDSTGKLLSTCWYVIHAVVPTNKYFRKDDQYADLQRTFYNVLNLGNTTLEVKSVAVPLIGTGVGIFSVPECAKTLKEVIVNFSRTTVGSRILNEIIIVNKDSRATDGVAEVFGAYHKRTQSDEAWGNSEDKGSSTKTTFVLSHEKRGPYDSGNRYEDSNDHSSEMPGRGSSAEMGGRGLKSESQLFSSHINVLGQHEENNTDVVQAKALQSRETEDDFKPFRPSVDKRDPSWSDVVMKSPDPSTSHAEDDCPICVSTLKDPKVLPDCKHSFCTECITAWFKQKKTCPICNKVYGILTGTQPLNGTMKIRRDRNLHLNGYARTGAIILTYDFQNGTQGKEHPNPGKKYTGTSRTAYLPNTAEGNEIARLLRKAFDARLVFTVGRSVTTGADNCVIWNDIHHKTRLTGGPTAFGYPDPGYLARVREELRAKGIE